MKIQLPESLQTYKGVIYFVVILLVSHFIWKFTMIGDESDKIVTFFGMDVSAPFNFMSAHVASVTAYFLDLAGYDVVLDPNNSIRHDNGEVIRIVWACSGLKQAYIFFTIIAFYPGSFRRKLWFIPAGLLVVYLFNIFRITYIIAAVKHNPEQFEFLHEHLFKYLFYGVIFLMWVLWEEKVRRFGLNK